MKICMRPSMVLGEPAPTRSKRKSISRTNELSLSIFCSKVSSSSLISVVVAAVMSIPGEGVTDAEFVARG